MGQEVEHRHDVLRQRLILHGQQTAGAPEACEDSHDMAGLAVEGQGTLGEIPHERRETAAR